MSKTDMIWDLVINLAEDEDRTGRINYGKKHGGGTGRMTVTLDGRRVTVYIEEAPDE